MTTIENTKPTLEALEAKVTAETKNLAALIKGAIKFDDAGNAFEVEVDVPENLIG